MRKVLFLIILLQLFIFDSKGQIENELDSLLFYLEDMEAREKGLVLNRFSFLLREKNLTQAFEFANEAEKIGIALNDSLIMAHAKENLGWIYYRSGVWDKAFRYSRDAYTISYRIKDNKGLAMAMNNLGVIYFKQKNYEEAIKKFKEAYSIGLELEDPFIMVRSLNNAAINFLAAVKPDSAYHYAYKALKINNEFNTVYFNSFTYRIIGDIQIAKNQVEDAIDTYNFAQHTATHHMLESFEASILHRMGNAYRLLGNLGKSIELLERGKDIALEKNFQEELIHFYKYLAMAYEQAGKLDLAYFNQMAFNRLSDILEDRINKDRLALVSAMFEVEKSDAEIRYLRAENDYQDLQLKNFKTYNFLFTIGTLVLAVLFVWLWSMHKKTKAINIELYMNQVKIEEQKAELEKHSKNLNESNRLKDRLFSILGHDLKTPVSQLQGVLGLLHDNNLTKDEFYELTSLLKRNVDGLFVTLDNILSWSRAQMEGFKVQLRPTDSLQIIKECIELLQQHADGKGITFFINVDQEIKLWVDTDLLQIILRNLIGNAVKYSRKNSEIRIEACEEGDFVQLSISDQGIGISKEKLEQIKNQKFSLLDSSTGTDNERGTGLGINLCKEFTRLMGGVIEFESKRNVGTKVSLKFRRVRVLSNSQNSPQQNMLV